jgi:hypothetical protein
MWTRSASLLTSMGLKLIGHEAVEANQQKAMKTGF